MNEGTEYADAFKEIVFAVTRLLFGDMQATSAILQELVKHALLNLGVWETIEGLKDN